MTEEDARLAVEKHGSQRAAARALGIHPKTLWQALRSTGAKPGRPKKEVGGAVADADERPVSVASGGFSLAGRQVLSARPTDLWKARFFALRRGLGYPIEVLASEWGKSPDSVKDKARHLGALRYVESPSKPGEYIVCAVHPETPKGK